MKIKVKQVYDTELDMGLTMGQVKCMMEQAYWDTGDEYSVVSYNHRCYLRRIIK